MFIKQLTVFMENREGRLEDVTKVLAGGNVQLVCVSLADTSEYGLLRLIVSDPVQAKNLLKANGFSAMVTDVLAIKLPHNFAMLDKLTKLIYDGNLNIEYMYSLTSGTENSSIIIKTSDTKEALKVIENSEFELLDSETAYNL